MKKASLLWRIAMAWVVVPGSIVADVQVDTAGPLSEGRTASSINDALCAEAGKVLWSDAGTDVALVDQAALTGSGLWVWNTEIVTDTYSQHEFLVFARLKQIGDTYLYAPDLLEHNPGELAGFVDRTGAMGIEVDLLGGDPAWALTPTHPVALEFVQQAITFTLGITQGTRPTGVHLDVEPHLLPEWDTDRLSMIDQYLDLLSDVKQELVGSGASLAFTVDIPFWYDTITATYNSLTKPLNEHVQDIADRVVIMDYRDFAEGSDGIIYHAQNEIAYGQSIGKGVVIGVETNDAEPEKVTFFEEGETVMESELALVEQYFQANPAFHGFALHDYSGYQALVPIRRSYLPLALRG